MPQHFTFPLRVASDGRLAALEQDSAEEVTQSVALLAATRPGERRSTPDYGVPDPLGGRGVDADDLVERVARFEDRADPALVEAVIRNTALQDVSVTIAPVLATPDEEE